jgi:hypothetical protein
MPSFRISRMPDGLGYLYGDYVADDGTSVRVDILMPQSEPRPPGTLKNDSADPTKWILYADGEEIGRVDKLSDAKPIVAQRLLSTS